jgi:hypothetical protein
MFALLALVASRRACWHPPKRFARVYDFPVEVLDCVPMMLLVSVIILSTCIFIVNIGFGSVVEDRGIHDTAKLASCRGSPSEHVI